MNATAFQAQLTAAAANAKATAAEAAIQGEILPALESLKQTTDKLIEINKTWRNNFKIINSTITALKRRIGFKISPPPLVVG